MECNWNQSNQVTGPESSNWETKQKLQTEFHNMNPNKKQNQMNMDNQNSTKERKRIASIYKLDVQT